MAIQRLSGRVNLAIFLFALFAMGKIFASVPPAADSVNFSEIREYAIFANAAYQTASAIRKLDLPENYALTHYSSIPEIEIAYFLLTNEAAKTQLISVRGTSNIENAIADVTLKLVMDKRTGVRLHNGFSLVAQAIYTEIRPYLNKDYVISSTGHSLGGAVALILAMYLDADDFEVDQVITFGQPKVTNIAGTSKFQHLNVIRVVTPKDVVPLVPPFDPLDLNKLDIYWHAGKEVILLPGNDYAILKGMNSMLRATTFTQEALTENNINNHMMSAYMKLLDKKIPTARLVPFKNNYNLFNLFGSDEK